MKITSNYKCITFFTLFSTFTIPSQEITKQNYSHNNDEWIIVDHPETDKQVLYLEYKNKIRNYTKKARDLSIDIFNSLRPVITDEEKRMLQQERLLLVHELQKLYKTIAEDPDIESPYSILYFSVKDHNEITQENMGRLVLEWFRIVRNEPLLITSESIEKNS